MKHNNGLSALILLSVISTSMAITWNVWNPSNKVDPPRLETTDWIKLDSQGQHVDLDKGPWRCASNTSTGLTWENKQATEGAFYAGWTYTWQDRHSTISAEGSCVLLRQCNTSQLIEHANRIKMCGFDDWRLPTLTELSSIIDHSVPEPGPRICDCLFQQTKRSSYWTSTRVDDASDNSHYGLNFKTLEVREFPAYSSLFVRLVRGKTKTTQ